MMASHGYTVKAGTRGRTVFVVARTRDGSPATGLDPESITAAYVRDDGQPATPISEPVSEVSPTLTPGVYQVAVPDAMIAVGATRAIAVISHASAVFDTVDIDLVMYDPQDSVRLGMTALGPEQRIDALRGAFPRLSELELKEREALEDSV